MKHFHTLTCNFAFGMIGDQIKEAIHLSILTGCSVQFEHNKVTLKVNSYSTVQKVYEDYLNKLKGD